MYKYTNVCKRDAKNKYAAVGNQSKSNMVGRNPSACTTSMVLSTLTAITSGVTDIWGFDVSFLHFSLRGHTPCA